MVIYILQKYINLKKISDKYDKKNILIIFYKKDFFIKILPLNSLISTNDVINTNYCNISICKTKYKDKIIILSAIDNLIKGGAGQAVQNLNFYYKFNSKKGLI